MGLVSLPNHDDGRAVVESFDIAMLFFGCLFLLAPLELCRDRARMDARRRIAEGVVVGHESQGTIHYTDHTTTHRPDTRHARIAFEVDGIRHECVSSVGASFTVHQIGQRVMVRFDPDNLSNADIAHGAGSDAAMRLLILGFPIAGALMIVFALMRLVP